MSEVDSRVAANGVNLEWLEDCGQYYAEYQYNGKTYKIWVEDQKSIGEKLNVMKENHLAGASFWKLGYEKIPFGIRSRKQCSSKNSSVYLTGSQFAKMCIDERFPEYIVSKITGIRGFFEKKD